MKLPREPAYTAWCGKHQIRAWVFSSSSASALSSMVLCIYIYSHHILLVSLCYPCYSSSSGSVARTGRSLYTTSITHCANSFQQTRHTVTMSTRMAAAGSQLCTCAPCSAVWSDHLHVRATWVGRAPPAAARTWRGSSRHGIVMMAMPPRENNGSQASHR